MPKKQNEAEERMQLTVDYAFKRVFGKNGNESILKDLLESILNIEIKSITIQNPEIPKNMRDGKVGVLDVRAELNGDEITEVEMQVQDQHNIDKRSPTYLTKIYSDQYDEHLADICPTTHVSRQMPPTFVWGVSDDKTAPIAQVYPFAQRMAEEGVVCEMHVFDQGGHGLSLGNANTAVDNEDKQVAVRPWIRLAFRFLERHGF